VLDNDCIQDEFINLLWFSATNGDTSDHDSLNIRDIFFQFMIVLDLCSGARLC